MTREPLDKLRAVWRGLIRRWEFYIGTGKKLYAPASRSLRFGG